MLNIRPIKESDVPALKDILSLYWTDKDFLEHLYTRLQEAVSEIQNNSGRKVTYFVAEKDSEVAGMMGFRKLPPHMAEYAKSVNPVELYIIAVKIQRKGTGRTLIEKAISLAKDSGYTEMLLFSPESLKVSWSFYGHMGFKQISSAIAPNGEAGQMFQKGFAS